MTDRSGSATRPDTNDQTAGQTGGQTDPVDGPPRKVVKRASEARQGKIVLDTPRKRWIFCAGLVGIVAATALAAAMA